MDRPWSRGSAWTTVWRRSQLRSRGLRKRDVDYMLDRGAWTLLATGAIALVPPGEVTDRDRLAGVLRMAGPRSTISHLTAARVRGWEATDGLEGLVPADEHMDVSVPRRRHLDRWPGVREHRVAVADHEVEVIDGLRVTSAVRTAVDLLLTQPRDVAVAAVDSAFRLKQLAPSDLFRIQRLLVGRHGAPRAREHARLLDPQSGSVLESLGRLRLYDAGLLPPRSQLVVRRPRSEDTLAVLDHAWPEELVGVEADGVDVHGAPRARFHDRQRDAALRALGWEIVAYVWADLFCFDQVVQRITEALERQRRRAVLARRSA